MKSSIGIKVRGWVSSISKGKTIEAPNTINAPNLGTAIVKALLPNPNLLPNRIQVLLGSSVLATVNTANIDASSMGNIIFQATAVFNNASFNSDYDNYKLLGADGSVIASFAFGTTQHKNGTTSLTVNWQLQFNIT